MKQNKYLVLLAVVLLVLLGLIVLKRVSTPTPTITQQVTLTPLVSGDVSKTDIAKLEFYNGGKPDEKTVLTRDPSDPNVWWVTSHFNAPADKEKIEAFIDKAIKLKGEPRGSGMGDASLESYHLTDAKAFHVKGYKKDAAEPAFAVLVGKAPAFDQVFMRPSASNDVYVLNTNLRREAGVYQDDPDTAPTADTWLKKEVVNIAKNTISKITVTTPDKRLAVVKEKKEVPIEDTSENDNDGQGSKDEGGDTTTGGSGDAPKGDEKPKTRTEEKWVLAEGGPAGLEVKVSGLENLAGAFAPLTASDIVDPAKLAEWGLESPQFTCALTVEGREGDVMIEGGRPDPNSDGYVRVASANKDVIFKLSKYNFERIFPKGTDLFDLPGLTIDKAQIASVNIVQPSGVISLGKTGDDWTIHSPAADLEMQKSTLDSIANALSSWKPADYADSAEAAGLDNPTRTITVTLSTGATHSIALGADAKGIAGAYARVDDGPRVLIMSKGDVDRIFPAPKDIFQRKLLSVDEDDINSIRIERASDSFQIARAGEDEWTLTVDGAVAEADSDACEDLAVTVADLEASDILFGQAALAGDAIATVHCVTKDGVEHVFRFGPEESGQHLLELSGKAQVFRADKEDVDDVLVASTTLKVEAPAPEEPPVDDADTAETPGDSTTDASLPTDAALPEEGVTTDDSAPASPSTEVVAPSPEDAVSDAGGESGPATESAPAEAAAEQ